MMNDEKRREPRIDTHNLISYTCLDENGQEVKQGMGRTLNVSEGGILLESHVPIDKQYAVSLTVSMEDDIMDILGKVAYCKEGENGLFETGVKFAEIDEEKAEFLKQYITIFSGETGGR